MRTVAIQKYDASWHVSPTGKRPSIWTGRYQLTLMDRDEHGGRLERTYGDLLEPMMSKAENFLLGIYNPEGWKPRTPYYD